MRPKNRKKAHTDRPTLPELDQTKTSVLNSLTSLQSRRSYQHAMDEFIEWYCSEPRLALNRAVVLRYRLQLEAKKLAASTINVRLAAVRRLAYEAADTGLLSPELVAGIRRVGSGANSGEVRYRVRSAASVLSVGIRQRAPRSIVLTWLP